MLPTRRHFRANAMLVAEDMPKKVPLIEAEPLSSAMLRLRWGLALIHFYYDCGSQLSMCCRFAWQKITAYRRQRPRLFRLRDYGYDESMAIDVTAQVRYWREGSADDLEAARALLEAGKVRQAAFFVHLAIEKAAKACVVAATRDLPPRSHDLLLLVERAGSVLSEPQREFLARVQTYCMEGRYPAELPLAPTADAVARDLQQAAEVIQWLTSRLKNL